MTASSRRLPAPPPGEPHRPLPTRDEELDDQPDPGAAPWDGEDEDDADAPMDEVPDDEDDEDDQNGLPDERSELADLEPLDAALDDDEDASDLSEEPDLEEELVDLAAPEDHELPILTWRPRVRVDGAAVVARLDPLAAHTAWVGAPFTGTRRVTVEVGGLRIDAQVVGVSGGQAEIVLGGDVLTGRFLLRL